MWRKTAFVLSLLVLLVTGVLGLYNGITENGQGETTFQQSVRVGVFLYGILGLVSAFGLFRRQRWSLSTALAWGIAITYVPGAAVMAYAGEDAAIGSAIAASGASALIALGVIWTTNVTTKPDALTQNRD